MKILLLGSGELGKEFTIAAQRIGQIVAVDSYENAPAMQVAHDFEVINMRRCVRQNRCQTPTDFIVPEIEAIRTERFYDYEKQGITVVPGGKLHMNRKAIRFSIQIRFKNAKYRYATTAEELQKELKPLECPW
jgi:phosphoribosylglycinamide formyltransferase 2